MNKTRLIKKLRELGSYPKGPLNAYQEAAIEEMLVLIGQMDEIRQEITDELGEEKAQQYLDSLFEVAEKQVAAGDVACDEAHANVMKRMKTVGRKQ